MAKFVVNSATVKESSICVLAVPGFYDTLIILVHYNNNNNNTQTH